MEVFTSFLKYEILWFPLWFFLFIGFIIILFTLMIISKSKETKLYWENNDLSNAKVKTRLTGVTPPFGRNIVVISPHKWVIVEWNKDKNHLEVWLPTHTYKSPDEYKIPIKTLNWKIIGELPKHYTTVKQHFKRQVM